MKTSVEPGRLRQTGISVIGDARWGTHFCYFYETKQDLLDTLVSATELAEEITGTVQEIVADLRPGVLDKLGLGAALHYEARQFQERTGVLCEALLPETETNLSTGVATALFRIFQECLTTIARHAHATKVEAALNLTKSGRELYDSSPHR